MKKLGKMNLLTKVEVLNEKEMKMIVGGYDVEGGYTCYRSTDDGGVYEIHWSTYEAAEDYCYLWASFGKRCFCEAN